MSKTEELDAAKIITRARLPECAQAEIETIDAFLRHFYDRIEHSANDHRVIAMTDRTDRLQGIIVYQRHQLATLKTLIASNLSRSNAKRPRKPR